MSDGVFIPGLSSKYNSGDAIKRIMESKNKKLDKLEDTKKEMNEEKSLWREVRTKTMAFQDKAKKLYGHEAPFDDKISLSSDENAFAAKVTKQAEIGEYRIQIKNKASAHRIASKQLNKDYKIPAGRYQFAIGDGDDDKIDIQFSGGTLASFATKLRTDSRDKLRVTVANDTSKTQVLIIESNISGEGKFIGFGNDVTKTLFKEMGFYEEFPVTDVHVGLDKSVIENTKTFENDAVINGEDKSARIQIKTDQEYRIPLPETVASKEGVVFEINLRTESFGIEEREKKPVPTGPRLDVQGDALVFELKIEGEPVIMDIPPYIDEDDPEPEIITDDHYIVLETNRRTVTLNELNVGSDDKKLTFELSDLLKEGESVRSVILNNKNTLKTLYAGDIRFYDREAPNGVKYKNELAAPADAVIVFDGLTIKRDKNTVDDLIPGVTLNIFDKTRKEESLKVDRDYESIVQTVGEFLGEYNQLLSMFNDEINVAVDEETGEEKQDTGRLSKDYNVKTLVSKLRLIMMNPYTTQYGSELCNLNQIGIGTNMSGAGFDSSKLKGILEINEDKFIDMMERYPLGIKEMFGRDNDGDMIIDSGIAYETESLLKAYTMRDRGYFDSMARGMDDKIQRQDKAISSYKDKLERDEKKLKEDFYKMEKSAAEMEESRKRFDNMNNGK